MFMTVATNGLIGAEQICKLSGYDVTGLTDELLNDQDFIMDLQIISCEVDLSKYISPKTSALMKVIHKSYEINQKNVIKNNIDTFSNDKDKIEKLMNLKKM